MASAKTTQRTSDSPAPPIRFPCGACGKNLRAPAKAAGNKVRCPHCHRPTLAPPSNPPEDETIPIAEPVSVDQASTAPRMRVMPPVAVLGVMLIVIGCSVYANLAFAVTNRANLKYFPPFKPNVNQNGNKGLGGEYFSIAKALVKGRGFADPFREETGPTTWMPPVLPFLLAGLLWACDNNVEAVMTVCLVLHVAVLVATALMVLALAWQTTGRLGILIAALIFLVTLSADFRIWFQQTHDMSIVLFALDIVIAGFAWGKPLQGWKRAACWGLAGGLCAMISPVVGTAWGVLTIAHMIRARAAWRSFGVAMLLAALTVTPWTVRNYLVFGRLIPVKSNAAYEVWQSQCKQKDGLLHHFHGHPHGSPGSERRLHKELGEMKFIDQKRALFWASVQADPLDFADRVAARFLGVTLWYEPFNLNDKTQRPVVFWLSRAWHPWPFLALVFLTATAILRPLSRAQWIVIGCYLLYAGPYIALSYYERYGVPLLAIKALLMIWAVDRVLCFLWPPRPTISAGG